MMDGRIARTGFDVQRLAPAKGAYWARDANLDGLAEPGDVSWKLMILYGNREWEFVIPRDGLVDDEWMAGMEIVGPIPEPA